MPAVEQVGGTHYGTGYGHWDYCDETNVPYLEACATKYVYRWRKKAGVEDLLKAISYIEKREASLPWYFTKRRNPQNLFAERRKKLYEDQKVHDTEAEICTIIFMWERREDLAKAKQLIQQLIDAAKSPAEDASPKYTNQG